MAGIYSPKNVGKLIFGGPLSAETTSRDFRANAPDGDVQVVSADGTAATLGKAFKVISRENQGITGVNISDKIEVDKITKIVASKFAPAVNKSVEVSGFTGTVLPNVTYRVSIRKYDHIQSPENFRHIHGFAVTGDTVGTYADVLNELKANLDSTLLRENSIAEFDIVVDDTAGTLTVTAKDTAYVQGKEQGDQILFDLEVSVRDNCPTDLCSNGYNDVLTTTVLQENDPGQGTSKAVANLEYFLNGYETADYGREVGYPANFNFSPNAVADGEYNSVQISFYSQRDYTNVERQHKELTIVFNEPGGAVADVNAFLAQLRVVLGNDAVPVDLV